MVPAALKGTLVIQKATCTPCQTKHTYEKDALKVDLLVPRVLLGLHGKKRENKKPLELPLVALGDHVNGGDDFNVRLTVAEYPPVLHMPFFAPAGLLVGEVRGGNLEQISFAFVDLAGLLKSNARPRTDVTTRIAFINGALSRTLAKIAYCFGVAELGLDGFDGREMRDFLYGKRDDAYNFVGGGSDQTVSSPGKYLHELQLRERGQFLTVLVRLFASCGAPTYEVVVGRVKA